MDYTPPSDKTNRFIFIGTGSGDYDADRLRRRRLFFRRWKETSAKPTSQLEKISSYVKATNGFNGHNVRFAFSIDEVLAKMKAGEDLDFASFPAYNSLKENLTKAKRKAAVSPILTKARQPYLRYWMKWFP